MLRYNKKIYFPQEDSESLKAFNNRINRGNFSFSSHCLDNLKYRSIDMQEVLQHIKNIASFYINDIFEYYKDNEIEKACYRLPYNKNNDVILVVSKYKKIITIYFNSTEDKHSTLDKKLYQQA